jgi:DNA-binding MarR family transcriptional regulator
MSNHSRAELIREFIAAIRASQVATDMLDEAVANHLGIHRTDARCLDILDQEGPMTAGRLAERARISPGATTTALDRLERKGLARRTRDTEDRRRVLVEVTPELRAMAERLFGTPEDGSKALEVYSDDELRFLIGFHRANVAFQVGLIEKLEAIEAGEGV